MQAIEILKTKHKLPVDSVVRSIQEVCTWELADQGWMDLACELRGIKTKMAPMPEEHLTKYASRYFVQNLVKANIAGDTSRTPDDLWLKSIQDGIRFIAENPWVFAKTEDDTPPKLNPDGSLAPKKGDKKVIAKKVYEDNKGKINTRKEWIALLVKEVGLTEAGASTYYANLKAGKY
jgi:hypothetical protein